MNLLDIREMRVIIKYCIYPDLSPTDRLMFHLALRCHPQQLRKYQQALDAMPYEVSPAFQDRVYGWLKQVFQDTQPQIDLLDMGLQDASLSGQCANPCPFFNRLFMNEPFAHDTPAYCFKPILMAVMDFARIPTSDFNAQSLYYLTPQSWLCARERPPATMTIRLSMDEWDHLSVDETHITRGHVRRPWFVPDCVYLDLLPGMSLKAMAPCRATHVKVYCLEYEDTDDETDDDEMFLDTQSFPELRTLTVKFGELDLTHHAGLCPHWTTLVVGSRWTAASLKLSHPHPQLRHVEIRRWSYDDSLLDFLVQHAEVPAVVTVLPNACEDIDSLVRTYRQAVETKHTLLRIDIVKS
jgi:hypothetical protein